MRALCKYCKEHLPGFGQRTSTLDHAIGIIVLRAVKACGWPPQVAFMTDSNISRILKETCPALLQSAAADPTILDEIGVNETDGSGLEGELVSQDDCAECLEDTAPTSNNGEEEPAQQLAQDAAHESGISYGPSDTGPVKRHAEANAWPSMNELKRQRVTETLQAPSVHTPQQHASNNPTGPHRSPHGIAVAFRRSSHTGAPNDNTQGLDCGPPGQARDEQIEQYANSPVRVPPMYQPFTTDTQDQGWDRIVADWQSQGQWDDVLDRWVSAERWDQLLDIWQPNGAIHL